MVDIQRIFPGFFVRSRKGPTDLRRERKILVKIETAQPALVSQTYTLVYALVLVVFLFLLVFLPPVVVVFW